jgi:hypothetical protein
MTPIDYEVKGQGSNLTKDYLDCSILEPIGCQPSNLSLVHAKVLIARQVIKVQGSKWTRVYIDFSRF